MILKDLVSCRDDGPLCWFCQWTWIAIILETGVYCVVVLSLNYV